MFTPTAYVDLNSFRWTDQHRKILAAPARLRTSYIEALVVHINFESNLGLSPGKRGINVGRCH